MLIEKLIRRLPVLWLGPGARVRLPGRTSRLREREAAAEVVVHRPEKLRGTTWAPSVAFGEAYMDRDLEIRGDLLALLKGYT